jgi:hypothetical protein
MLALQGEEHANSYRQTAFGARNPEPVRKQQPTSKPVNIMNIPTVGRRKNRCLERPSNHGGPPVQSRLKSIRRVRRSPRWLVAVSLLALGTAALGTAQAAHFLDFEYELSDAGEAFITGYTGGGEMVSVPEAIDGHPVTRIGDGAFEHCTSLTSVYFQGDMPPTYVEPGAFRGCPATMYYRPGAWGWRFRESFDGRPTALWLAGLAVVSLPPDGPFKIAVSGPAGAIVRLQRSFLLVGWEDWQTLTLGRRPTEVEDSQAAWVPYRFYRTVEE